MEIEFREKKKYCKDADRYVFNLKDTKERKSKVRKIIKIILVTEAVIYLSNGGEPSPDGGGSPFSVASRRIFVINIVNVNICCFNYLIDMLEILY